MEDGERGWRAQPPPHTRRRCILRGPWPHRPTPQRPPPDAPRPRPSCGAKAGPVYLLTSAGALLNGNYPFRPGLSTDEFQTAPLYRSGVIVIGSTTGKVFVIDQNNGTGPALYQTFNFQSAVSTISYDTDGYYIVGTADGKLYYLNGVTDPTSGSI